MQISANSYQLLSNQDHQGKGDQCTSSLLVPGPGARPWLAQPPTRLGGTALLSGPARPSRRRPCSACAPIRATCPMWCCPQGSAWSVAPWRQRCMGPICSSLARPWLGCVPPCTPWPRPTSRPRWRGCAKALKPPTTAGALGLMAHEVAAQVAPHLQCGALSGPSFAQEVARGQPTCLVAASRVCRRASSVASGFSQPGAARVCQ